MAHAGGRPSEFSKLPEGWQEMMIEMGKEGCSVSEVACRLGVLRQRMYDMVKNEPQFADTFTRMKQECQAWWEMKGRTQMENRDFNSSLWSFNVKNRFRKDWQDSKSVEHSGEVKGSPQISFADTTHVDDKEEE